jgi:transposase InsO family protein
MGRVASSVDNALTESYWSTMQRELLDRTTWDSRAQLASAMFEWILAFYNPGRRRSSLGDLSPAEFGALHTATGIAA